MLKAIIFDVDGVLVDSKEANIALFQTLLQKSGYPIASREAILECFHLPLWQSLEKLTGSNDELEIQRIMDLAKDPSVRDPTLFRFPEQLEDLLEQLHKKYKLAIVTSRIKVGMDGIFNVRKIKHLFDTVVTFEDYRNPKPHPEPLLIAVKRLNLLPEEALYIGDSVSDVVAAQAAGMKSIHLARSKYKHATAGVKEFHELLSAVETLA